MAITRGQFTDLVNPAIREIYFRHLGKPGAEYNKVFTMETSGRDQEITSEIYGLGAAPEKLEGGSVVYDDPVQGYDYTYRHITYGLGFIVTFEMQQDDLHGKIKQMPEALADAMQETYEVAAANVFNNAFSGVTYGDGAALCSSAHVNEYDGVADETNVLTTPADFATTSLKAAITQMTTMVGPRGEYLGLKPALIVHPPALEFDVCQVLKSNLLPGTDINDINSIRTLYDLRPQKITRLTDTDAWFLLGEKRNQLKFWWRYKADLKDDLHIGSRDVEYNSVMRFSVGASGWRFLIGTPGVA